MGGKNGYANASEGKGETGTGGLLVIYANDFNNVGNIYSKGSRGTYLNRVSGGSSGGGSINIFCKEKYIEGGEIQATGGSYQTCGSSGGDGSISVGNISTGTYENTYKNY